MAREGGGIRQLQLPENRRDKDRNPSIGSQDVTAAKQQQTTVTTQKEQLTHTDTTNNQTDQALGYARDSRTRRIFECNVTSWRSWNPPTAASQLQVLIYHKLHFLVRKKNRLNFLLLLLLLSLKINNPFET